MNYEQILGLYEYFQPVYDIKQERKDYWKQFIPTRDFIDSLGTFLNSLSSRDSKTRKSMWLQGTYGTGKSHATGVIKHLLWDEVNHIEDFIEKIPDNQIKEKLRNFRKENRVFPVILKGISGIDNTKSFSLIIEEAVKNALKAENIEIKTKSEFEKYIENIQNDKSIDWRYIVDNNIELKSVVGDIDGLLKELANNNVKILSILEESTAFHIPHPSIEQWLSEVLLELQNRGISHIAIYWDEFTPIIELSTSSAILTILQNIAEKSFNENIFLFVISHRLPEQSQVSRMDQEKILGRFEFKTYSMENITTFHIISNTIKKKDYNKWKLLRDDSYDKNSELVRVLLKIAENDLSLINVVKDLFPIHPYTAQLATALSRYIGSTERSIFNFLYDDKKGFFRFIKEYPKEDTKEYFLTADVLWDYFLDDFKRRQEEKINTIVAKYNMYYEILKNKGPQYLAIFKGILLLNLIQSYVALTPSEGSIYAPSEDNIRDMFLGTSYERSLDEVLEYIDQKCIQMDPNRFYLISQTPLPTYEVSQEKELAKREYKDITRFFSIEKKDLLGEKIKSNILREANVQVYWAGISIQELRRIIKNNFINSYTLNIALFLSKNKSEIRELEDKLKEIINEVEEAKDIIFIISDSVLKDDNYDKLIEYNARRKVAEKHMYAEEAKINTNYIDKIIEQWLNKIETDYVEIIFQDKAYKKPFNLLYDEINKSLSPQIFRFGLEQLERLTENRNVWKTSFPEKVAEIFLYEDRRDFLEDKLKNAPYKYLLGILQSDRGEYIVDKTLRIYDDTDPDHPTVRICKEVERTLEMEEGKNFNLGDVLGFLKKPPYGLYPNKVNYAVLSLALKPFVGKLSETGTGRRLTKEILKEKVTSLFKYWTSNKDRDSLEVRLGTNEEKELTDTLTYLFNIEEGGNLNNVRWNIWKWIKLNGLPIWSIKTLVQGNKGLCLAIEAIDYLVRTIDRELLEDKVKSILEILKYTKTDLRLLLSAEKIREGFMRWLKNLEDIKVDDEEVKEVIDYLHKNMQEEVALWNEDKIKLKLKDWEKEKEESRDKIEFIKILREIFRIENAKDQRELKEAIKTYIDKNLCYPLWIINKVINIDSKLIKFIEEFIRLDYEFSREHISKFLDDLKTCKSILFANLQRNILEQGMKQWLREKGIPEEDIPMCLGFIRNNIDKNPHLWRESDLEEHIIQFSFTKNMMNVFKIEDNINIRDLRDKIKSKIYSTLYPFWSFELVKDSKLSLIFERIRKFITSDVQYPTELIKELLDMIKENLVSLEDLINKKSAEEFFIGWLRDLLGFEEDLQSIASEIRRKMKAEDYYWNKDRVENWIRSNLWSLISEKKKERIKEKVRSTNKDLREILLNIVDKHPQIISDLENLL